MSVDVQGKSLVELLDMLEPAPVPAPIPMTPQTWGWVVLAVLVFSILTYGLYAVRRHRQSNAYRRAALRALDAADNDVAEIAEILRRTALAAYPRDRVASLHGTDWISFLSQSAEKKGLSESNSKILSEAPFRTTSSNPAIESYARQWIKTHKAERRLQ